MFKRCYAMANRFTRTLICINKSQTNFNRQVVNFNKIKLLQVRDG